MNSTDGRCWPEPARLLSTSAWSPIAPDAEAKRAFSLLNGLKDRLAADATPKLKDEEKLVGKLLGVAAFYSGYGGEQPQAVQPLAVRGKWKVQTAEGMDGLRAGDMVEIDEDYFTVSTGRSDEEEDLAYQINETSRS